MFDLGARPAEFARPRRNNTFPFDNRLLDANMELLSVGAMNRLKQLRDVRFLLREEQRQRDERSDAVGSSG